MPRLQLWLHRLTREARSDNPPVLAQHAEQGAFVIDREHFTQARRSCPEPRHMCRWEGAWASMELFYQREGKAAIPNYPSRKPRTRHSFPGANAGDPWLGQLNRFHYDVDEISSREETPLLVVTDI